ncbi:hypothetical protein C8T65DRAFT_641686 [Cerioporus squamosus]|nr:hypothetical protein C8T65DRAFT_641686 [Cerioporus squamosus]
MSICQCPARSAFSRDQLEELSGIRSVGANATRNPRGTPILSGPRRGYTRPWTRTDGTRLLPVRGGRAWANIHTAGALRSNR